MRAGCLPFIPWASIPGPGPRLGREADRIIPDSPRASWASGSICPFPARTWRPRLSGAAGLTRVIKYYIDYLTMTAHREFKDSLYGQFARIGKAVGSPHRFEILELLAQGERTVDSVATEMGLSLANASQQLQALRRAALVDSRQ